MTVGRATQFQRIANEFLIVKLEVGAAECLRMARAVCDLVPLANEQPWVEGFELTTRLAKRITAAIGLEPLLAEQLAGSLLADGSL